jgi:hypothetical protein
MYSRPRFLELLIEIREEMARQADFDVDLFVEKVRSGKWVSDVQAEAVAEKPISKKKAGNDNHLQKQGK